MRIDRYLVENGRVSSRARAQELIASGQVFVIAGGEKRSVKKPSLQIEDGWQIEVAVDQAQLFVSRGGIKLQGALERIGLSVKGASCLDLGVSTGGFTDCLLRAGAARVVGIDVGHGQLAHSLANEPRLHLLEGMNARNLAQFREQIITAHGLVGGQGGQFDIVVADLSFISLTLVLPDAIQYLKETASLLALVKPQFEAGPAAIGKNGIVKDPIHYPEVEAKIRQACEGLGMNVEDYFESSIEGSDGNREFFVHARPR